ncbi:hypothetical protein GMOD_00002157 [Pyrenophora seminiperda CCB06]|uniref:HTH araC/xylS-type domain-containing protein n=1 Tax=Pyrenophora seminiperda CCB06 TaxID=1302712 RepID=A0A3M7LX26_9PLEO|nr:hypothetical protein GMOD_00002157 [Pyrenophora seminiperda CCB06]
MAYTTDSARWRALTVRDVNADGHFIYSVKSTNIYCRPTCPARLARRANVSFYSTPFEAEAAGFRACNRCKPKTVLENPQERAVEKACLLIDEALNKDGQESLKLKDLARKINFTPRYFHKIFKDKTGLTPKEYASKKAADRNRLSATPPLPTTTDKSTQLRDWDAYDFSDLVDLGGDSSPVSMNTFVVPEEQLPTMYTDLDFDFVGASQALNLGYDTDLTCPWLSECSNFADPFYNMPEDMYHRGENAPSASLSEPDAVALLECDGPTEL